MDKEWMAMLVAVLVLALTAAAWRRRGRRPAAAPAPDARVTATDGEIVATAPDGAARSIRWDDLARVTIRTTDGGPWVEDVFWLLEDAAGRVRVLYPGGADGAQALLAAMQARLDGFDDGRVVEAMGSTGNAAFRVWERTTG